MTIIDINGSFEQTDSFETCGYSAAILHGAPQFNLELAENNASPWSRRTGRHSLRMVTEGLGENGCFDALVSRRVTVGKGALLVLSGYNRVWCGETWGQPSDINVNVFGVLGIDPTGTGDGWRWSTVVPNPHFAWIDTEVRDLLAWAFGAHTAVALADDVLIGVRSNLGWVGAEDAGGPPCRWPHHYMTAFWDDLALDVTAPAEPPPPPPPVEPPPPSAARTWEIDVMIGGVRVAGTVRQT